MSIGVSSCQNFAVSVWNGVRTVLVALPKALTSLKSVAYCALSSAGGPAGRNCDGEVSANGVVVASVRNFGGPDPPGVTCQSPGAVPNVYGGGVALKPSVDRQATIWLATVFPQARPLATDASDPPSPSLRAATDAARSASSAAFCDGKSNTCAV